MRKIHYNIKVHAYHINQITLFIFVIHHVHGVMSGHCANFICRFSIYHSQLQTCTSMGRSWCVYILAVRKLPLIYECNKTSYQFLYSIHNIVRISYSVVPSCNVSILSGGLQNKCAIWYLPFTA